MSYILDALKKSENEREQARLESERGDTVIMPPTPGKKKRGFTIALVSITIVSVSLLVWQVFFTERSSGIPSENIKLAQNSATDPTMERSPIVKNKPINANTKADKQNQPLNKRINSSKTVDNRSPKRVKIDPRKSDSKKANSGMVTGKIANTKPVVSKQDMKSDEVLLSSLDKSKSQNKPVTQEKPVKRKSISEIRAEQARKKAQGKPDSKKQNTMDLTKGGVKEIPSKISKPDNSKPASSKTTNRDGIKTEKISHKSNKSTPKQENKKSADTKPKVIFSPVELSANGSDDKGNLQQNNLQKEKQYPHFSSLSLDIQRTFPQPEVNVHVYDSDPENRFALISLERYQEGDSLKGGIVIEEITPDGFIFSYKGKTFSYTNF